MIPRKGMLTSLHLKNFKGWQDTGQIKLAPITLFFGANSSGKSSLLQSLLLLKQSTEATNRSRPLFTGDKDSLVDLGQPVDLIFGHKESILEFKLGWNDGGLPVVVRDTHYHDFDIHTSLSLNNPKKPDFVVSSLDYSLSAPDAQTVKLGLSARDQDDGYDLTNTGAGIKRRPGRPWPIPKINKFYSLPYEAETYYSGIGWVVDLEFSLESKLSKLAYVGPLRQHPERQYSWAGTPPQDVSKTGGNAVTALLASIAEGRKVGRGHGRGTRYTPFQEVVADWLQRLGMIHSFQVTPVAEGRREHEVRVRRSPQSAEVLITDVGFGVSQVLPVIVQCFYAKPGDTVIFEQPEIHLHPAVQALLGDLFIEASKLGVQFIIESHSEHLLHRIQRRIAEGGDTGIEPSDVAAYRCALINGRSTIDELIISDSGDITNWPQDFFGDSVGDLVAMRRAALERAAKPNKAKPGARK